ncbi:hypothetical protein Q8W71_31755 [Methylobacterium sp. NEAU 140]|uniref:hypothetical protein n=1 Tax=Methylobacterium sp. NEAU 140 TaxID=3064945 RepID=UPI0027341BD5|nr:hypothetical protein [Methylobacterium sp. NEAU 140]MDP4027156.1 hypothetical protein [Methylobacterium sp. NEAU 140]
MPHQGHRDKDLRPELAELGRTYLDALAWRDARAGDPQLVLLRTQLGTILALLGWRPDGTVEPMPRDPGPARERLSPGEGRGRAGRAPTMCLKRRARRRARVRARARIMHGRYGSDAYDLARERARRPDGRRTWFWTRVAIALAHLEGREIGVRASDRWR